MNYPMGTWTTIGDYRDISDNQRILFRKNESNLEYMIEYPFDCFTACVILQPMNDDLTDWKGTCRCYVSDECSEMFSWLTAESDKIFGIGGLKKIFDIEDFNERQLYDMAITACSKWIDEIKTYNLRYNTKVNKMSFKDMVKSVRIHKGIQQLLDERILNRPNYEYADDFDIKIDGKSHHFFTSDEGRSFYSDSLDFEMSLDGKGATFSHLGGDESHHIPDIGFQEAIEEFENWCILKLKGHW